MKKYGSDYRKKEDGYEYTGEWYCSRLSPEQLSKEAVHCFVLLAPATALFLAGLSFDNAAGRIFWILMPYVSMIFPLAYGWMGSAVLYEFCRKQKAGKAVHSDGRGRADSNVFIPEEQKGKMVRSEYEKGIRRPWSCAAAMVILSSLTLGTDIWMLYRHTSEMVPTREICFAGITFGIFLHGVLLMRQCGKIKRDFVHDCANKRNI